MYEWEIAWKSHKLWSVNITSSWCHLTCRIPDICTDWNWTIWQYQDLADWLKHKALSSIYVSCKDSWMANDVTVEQSWGIFLPLDMTNLSRSWKMYEMILIWWMGSTDGYIAQLNSLRARSSKVKLTTNRMKLTTKRMKGHFTSKRCREHLSFSDKW